MEPLISFVIPAHNAAKTLLRCVGSIQTYNKQNIEIIIVENGSEDNTVEIAKELCDDPRVKLFYSSVGVSNARNVGIIKSIGKYVVFVDADDQIVAGGVEILIHDAETMDEDIVAYGHCIGNKRKIVSEYKVINDIDNVRCLFMKNPTKYMQVWAKLIKRKVIVDNNVSFNINLRLSEDSDFMLRLLRYSKNICLSDDCIYMYTLNPDSTMRTFDGKMVNDYAKAMTITGKSIENESEIIKNAFNCYVAMHMNIAMVREVFNHNNNEKFLKKIVRMKKICRSSVFSKALKSISISECKSIRMIPVFLIKMKLFCLASYVYKLRAYINYMNEKKNHIN